MKNLRSLFGSRLPLLALFLLSSAGLAVAQPVITGISSVHSAQPAVAPYGLAVMEGQNIADQDGNAEVTVNGVPALVVPEPGLTSFVTFQIPRETAVGPANFVVSVGGVASAPFSFPVSAFAPVIASEGNAYRADQSLITGENPPSPGERILITGVTGLGAADPPQVGGAIGGLPVQVISVQDNVFEFFLPGVYTLEMIVPEGLSPGLHPAILTVGGATFETTFVVGTEDGRARPTIDEITGGVAPRGIAMLFGQNVVDENRNVEVRVNGVSALILPDPGSTRRITFQIPAETAVGLATFTVSVDGLVSEPFSQFVAEFAPTLTDDAAVLGLDQMVIDAGNPADPGEIVFITGITGLGAQESPQVSVMVGFFSAEVLSLRENVAQASALQDSLAPVVYLDDTTPGVYTLEMRVPEELPPDSYSWSLTVGDASISRDNFLFVGSGGEQQLITVVSAANFKTGSLAAETIVSGFSGAVPSVFAPVTELPLPTTFADTKVVVTDSAGVARDSLLFGVFTGQVNFLIPAMTAVGTATISLQVLGQSVASGTVEIAEVAPGVFTANAKGTGVAAAFFIKVPASGGREEGFIFDPATLQAVPLDLGGDGDLLYLSLFGTGMRGGGGTGVQQTSLEVLAEVNGVSTGVLAVADSPEFAGLDQVAIGPIDRDRLSGKGEVDIELWFSGVSTGPFTAAFGGDVITPSPEIVDVTPPLLIAGATSSVTLTGNGLMPVNRVEFSPDSGLTVSNIVGMNTMATFDVMVDADASLGMRNLGVVTPDGRSNRYGVEVVEPTGSGTAPIISELSDVVVAQMDDHYLIALLFNWEDPDGDITWRGDVTTSAKAEVRLTGDSGECVFLIGGPMVLDLPGRRSGPPVVSAGMSGQAPTQVGTGMAAVTLFDAAQNQSNTLTTEVGFEPAPGACDPNVPIVLTRSSVEFVTQ